MSLFFFGQVASPSAGGGPAHAGAEKGSHDRIPNLHAKGFMASGLGSIMIHQGPYPPITGYLGL